MKYSQYFLYVSIFTLLFSCSKKEKGEKNQKTNISLKKTSSSKTSTNKELTQDQKQEKPANVAKKNYKIKNSSRVRPKHLIGGTLGSMHTLYKSKSIAMPRKFNTESYDVINENRFNFVKQSPLSTFSVDVDTASYSNIRRFLNKNNKPPKDAVRIEEMINYFDYSYKPPIQGAPFSVNAEVTICPWSKQHKLVRIGIKGKKISSSKRPASNLVFLLDVSGSMYSSNKLPLLKRSLEILLSNLNARDKVAIVVYAGASGVVLPSTKCDNKVKILESLNKLRAGGSTNAGSGIKLAYQIAKQNFIKGGINRIILATDGDFNVGVTNRGDLINLVQKKAKSGIFLTVLGFGMGNYKDSMLEQLADKGNGNYAYIDNYKEAVKVFGKEIGGTLVTIAKDVKIQVEFNPSKVKAYRLIGYENRKMAARDFNDDKKDAGEIGAGHTVTALYEIVPPNVMLKDGTKTDKLRYQKQKSIKTKSAFKNELMFVKIRYKKPSGTKSKLIKFPLTDFNGKFEEATEDTRFAASVVMFGMLLRESEYKGNSSFNLVKKIANKAKGKDKNGYRKEFIHLVSIAQKLYK